ncbi:MAG: peptide-methionine (S)-S-oxide reductase MsrA [Rhodospirillales bacterium]|nr:peptide-methionine (S)-S-oxide reductase MsrA [Rhodospirillales bacterium]MCW9039487.1 peptide-methionine (S)-S-oxide reductase MsrA [Rhodospirillales bacterium]
MEKATFGAGCFWGVELAFQDLPGVVETAVGYEGGHLDNPNYKDVCTDTTGHAEVVEVTFDPARIGYEKLLEVFWGCHDPTQWNRQGPDFGSQYRSVIFFHSPEQEDAAKESKARMEADGRFGGPIVTLIEPALSFWRAEDYHQNYLKDRGYKACH